MTNREMKESGVEWIGAIPKSWNIQRVKRKFIYKKEKVGEKSEEYERLSLTLRGVLKRPKNDNEGLQPEKFSGYQILEHNDLVFKLIDLENISTSRVGLSSFTGIVSPAYIRLICLDDINSKFAYYFFISMWHQNIFNGLGGDGVRSNLNSTDLLNLSFVEVPKAEQQKIAAFLDEKVAHIDNIIEDTKQSIENLKAYKQSLITETVTKGLDPTVEMKDSGIDWIGKIPKHWISSRIKYVTNISRGQFSHRPRNDERYYDGQYPFIQTGDVARAKKYITTYSQTLNELGKSVSKEFPKGTLVMNIAANVGDVAILDFDSYFPDSVVGFVPKEKYHWNYLYYTFTGMKSMFVRTAISNTQLNLNVDRIKDMHVPVTTDYNEQLKISEFLDKKVSNIDALLEKKGEVVTELESYKKALIYEYVTGKKEVK